MIRNKVAHETVELRQCEKDFIEKYLDMSAVRRHEYRWT